MRDTCSFTQYKDIQLESLRYGFEHDLETLLAILSWAIQMCPILTIFFLRGEEGGPKKISLN